MTTPEFLAALIDAIAKTIPADANQSKADRDANLVVARELLEAFHPTDAVQAAQAARAVATHMAAMDSFARAARAGVDDEKVIRLRGNALAAARLFDTLFRSMDRQRQPAPAKAQPQAPASPGKTTAPAARVHHRAELSPPIPGLPNLTAPMTRKDGWHSATALSSAQPTVIAPG